MSTRQGGVSAAPFDSAEPGHARLATIRRWPRTGAALAQALGARPVWLQQVHGARWCAPTAWPPMRRRRRPMPPGPTPAWPASCRWPTACRCCSARIDGRAVGAAHAGWRGLAAGVLEATVQRCAKAAGVSPLPTCRPGSGPASVRRPSRSASTCAMPSPTGGAGTLRCCAHAAPDGAPRWRPICRRWRGAPGRLGCESCVTAASWCTVSDPSRFFSYRRDGVTGRFAAAVWRRG
jgi:hypothetical protein